MATSPNAKTERLEARITQEQKRLFERAAGLAGRSLTDFVVSSLDATARQTIREHETMQLSASDSEAFVEALLEPSGPNARLRKAAQAYRQANSG